MTPCFTLVHQQMLHVQWRWHHQAQRPLRFISQRGPFLATHSRAVYRFGGSRNTIRDSAQRSLRLRSCTILAAPQHAPMPLLEHCQRYNLIILKLAVARPPPIGLSPLGPKSQTRYRVAWALITTCVQRTLGWLQHSLPPLDILVKRKRWLESDRMTASLASSLAISLSMAAGGNHGPSFLRSMRETGCRSTLELNSFVVGLLGCLQFCPEKDKHYRRHMQGKSEYWRQISHALNGCLYIKGGK